ncbi:MAG: type I-E CRISPR-associated protein Cas7/Cse4/CasC [Syntrophomonadaceae bacterium]|jgi:CRISPR system Cascade subunit CasC|nr:type I-E CRISPR-associated protein Cas7/Cse4/CasC [Syntrophomonadaceae bacterium]
MTMSNLYVDLHVIQTVPPSCLNRDDTGSPKTAVYGGVRRARVSSQAWKHAMREMFKKYFDEQDLGVRTKKIVELVAKEIKILKPLVEDSEISELAEKIINKANVKTADGEAKALFFMSIQQAKNLAELAVSDEFDKKTAQDALNKGHGIDIALFGRMVADDPSLNADASAQVAHAISTHKVDNEFDYFTAADDRAPEDNAGAGMIGTVEYNSSTLYRYATVAVHELFGQLANDSDATAKAVVEFVRAFVLSMPSGKMNTFANRTPPDAVYIVIRNDMPVNLAGAFETPVRSGSGYVGASLKALGGYAENVYGSFALKPEKSYVVTANNEFNALGNAISLDVLLENIEADIKGALLL